MIFIGDYFALSLVLMLVLFFFDGKHSLNRTSRFFVSGLGFTAATALSDIATGSLLAAPVAPLWLNMAVNTLYFLVNILSTSSIALYLFARILEHSHNRRCMRNAVVGLALCFVVYMGFLLGNIQTGWLFYFDAAGAYCRGPFNGIGYIITVAQMVLVLVCYLRNRRNASATMRRVLIQTFPVIVLSIIIQRMYPEIMLNSFIMSMVCAVLFLAYNGQRPGVHSLTRLNDRHRFFEGLDRRIRKGEAVQIFMINIKNYGIINQKYGHMFGDELLYQFAFALEKLLRGSEAYHMNGTVFAITLPYSAQHEAEENRMELLDFLAAGIRFSDERVLMDCVAVEAVAATKDENAAELYELLEYAAGIAYSKKLRYMLCTNELRSEMLRRRYLVERMQVIDRGNGFATWFQPIRCRKSGRYCSLEALVRIVEPDGSIISPGEFIPVAEQAGMITPITWFVVEDVCRILKENRLLDRVSVSINLPMAQLLEPGFSTRLNSIVDSYGIEHSRICLEFTERAILENFDKIKSAMLQLTGDGYKFFLDDFGAGYSNFNCLLQLPFQVIKLDMNLIRMDIGDDGTQKLGLVRTLTNFLHEIGMLVVAEGVETQQTAAALEDLGVDRIQGYAFAEPMPEKQVLEFYRKH